MKAKYIKRAVASGAALLVGLGTQVATASASTAPTEGDNCGTNGSGVYNCMYIQGVGDSITEMRGWSRIPASYSASDGPFHEQITGPTGATVCNSGTVTPNGSGTQIVSCQVGPGNYAAGQYCSTSWEYYPDAGTLGWYKGYYNKARNCVTIP